MNKRKVWVEPLFAEAKDWHGLRRFRLRLLWRTNIEALRIATGQNLKRLLKKRGWRQRPFPVEAMSAFFFASSGRLTHTTLEFLSVALFVGADYFMSKRGISLTSDELSDDFFNKLCQLMRRIIAYSHG